MTERRAQAMAWSRVSKGSRTLSRITPCATTVCLRPSLSMTPQPVRSVPQSMPRTRAFVRGDLRHGLQLFFVDVEIGINVLHVVVFFHQFGELQHAPDVLASNLQQILRHHS